MRARWWLNLGLVAVAAALGWLLARQPGVEPATDQAPLTTRDPASVRHITVRRVGTEPIEITRDDAGRWRLSAPLKARAEPKRAEGLARLAAARSGPGFTADAAALAEYGLQSPRLTLDLDETHIALGAEHPLGRERYALVDGKVRLVGLADLRFVPVTAADLIDPRLFAPGESPVTLELPGFRLAQGEKAWSLEPAGTQPSQDRLVAFVDEWIHARAVSVKPHDGQAPTGTIKVELEIGGQRVSRTFGIVARAPELVLLRADEGLEYHFPAQLGARLLAPPAG